LAEIDEIKALIKNSLEALNIAVVYDRIPHLSAWDKILQKAVKNNSLNLIMFTYSTRRALTSEDNITVQAVRGWRVKYFMSVCEKSESGAVFDRNIESICMNLNELGSTDYRIEIVSPPEMLKPKEYETVCGILCHSAELEFEIINNS
jgi:hypothetical protein